MCSFVLWAVFFDLVRSTDVERTKWTPVEVVLNHESLVHPE